MSAHTAFSASEIVDIARQVERCGEAFYEHAARKVKNPRVAALFRHLQGEEVAHAGVFEKLLSRLALGPAEWRKDDDYVGYMRALADKRVFPNPDAAAEAVAALRDERAAIDLALRFEKDTILFLQGLRRMVQPEDASTLDDMVAEEETHVARLQAMAKDLAPR